MASKPSWEVIVGLVAVVVLAWVSNLLVGFAVDEKGVFGDQFGAVNALFSGLAFSGVVYAILLQRYEVGLLQEELARTKDILDEQKKLAAEQLTGQRKQAFETTFFNLLELFNSIVSGMDLKSNNKPDVTGRDVFKTFVSRIYDTGRKLNPKHKEFFTLSDIPEPAPMLDSEEAYKKFYDQHHQELGHYFRMLYNIVKFVDNSDVADKKFYTNIVRAQLSNDEVSVLFLNVLSEHGVEKMKPFVEKYTLLKNLNRTSEIFMCARGRENLAPSAFE